MTHELFDTSSAIDVLDKKREVRPEDSVHMQQLQANVSLKLALLNDGVLPEHFDADGLCLYLARFHHGRTDHFDEDLERFMKMGS